jgi:hypothetical protein
MHTLLDYTVSYRRQVWTVATTAAAAAADAEVTTFCAQRARDRVRRFWRLRVGWRLEFCGP